MGYRLSLESDLKNMKNSIGRRIFLSNFIVIFLTIIIFEVFFGAGVYQFYFGGVLRVLKEKSLSNASFYNMYLKYESLEKKANTILENYNDQDKAELQIVDIQGKIIASSSGIVHSKKIDMSFKNSLKANEVYSWQEQIENSGEEVLSVITPLVDGDTVAGYLRLVTSLEDIKEVVNNLLTKAIILGIIILILSSIVAVILSQSIVRPIKHLTIVSRKIANGDLNTVASKRFDDEIGELSDTLNFMSEEIKKSNNLKNDFISSISHEIRTPLTSIRGWAETIDENLIENEETKQGIRIISRESERLTKLVEELLDFSKLESGRIEMSFDKVDLNLLIKDVLKQYTVKEKHFQVPNLSGKTTWKSSLKFEEKNIEIIYNLDDKITYIDGDSDRLRQVFINILNNACKFSFENGRVTVCTEHTQAGARVSIEDNGTGIASQELKHVTEKFYKGKSKKSGSGLGLSISMEIIRLHKGSLLIESIEGKGTKVIVDLSKM